jgi:hypothetical protein
MLNPSQSLLQQPHTDCQSWWPEIRGNVFASNVRGGNYVAVLTDRQASSSVCSAANITVRATVDESFRLLVPQWSFNNLNKPVQGIHVHGPANQCTGGPVQQAFFTIEASTQAKPRAPFQRFD